MSSSENKKQTSQEWDLLLIGKTGNGKSATGNAILNSKAFTASASSSSVTSVILRKTGKFKDRILNVVDAPGVLDTGALTETVKGSTAELITKELEQAIKINPRGYNAFILVTKYGNRFTEDDRNAIHILKQIFGSNFLRDFGILVMTGGDTFEADDHGKTFIDWAHSQKGIFHEVLTDCISRVVLFDNLTKDPLKKEKQVDELMVLVDRLDVQGRRYTDKHFQEALKTRLAYLLQFRAKEIEATKVKEIEALKATKEKNKNEAPAKQLIVLNEILKSIGAVILQIVVEDQGTDVYKDLQSSAQSFEREIKTDILVNEAFVKANEAFVKEREAIVKERDSKVKESSYCTVQ